ncbi:uncharacterized protein LOC131029067 [Cryptomeria japonica]|uniref:uncharacterized protein LOC131029067 n=1 Tax=Cryptomeria japonica TaxID=3369 RepID=UPI0027DA513B|nr:uncharacterized protein LOC131029067 [Cryptomeria japonica]
MNVLTYKLKHDQYYKDVIIDLDAVQLLPEHNTDILELFHSVPSPQEDFVQDIPTVENINNEEEIIENSSSFIPQLPSSIRELDVIKKILLLDNTNNNVVPWPQISTSPVNEYNIEDLLLMAFPTLFPNGMALPLQDRARHVHLHEYALHLIKYYDQIFGQHVRFRYYIYNLMMRHRSEQSAVVFIKTNLEDSLPLRIHGLREYLQKTPSNELPNHIMRYVASLRGTRAFWRKF